MSKPKQKRDVLQETIDFMNSRKGRGTTVATAAAGLKLSTPGARYRLTKLESQGRVVNDHGYYRVPVDTTLLQLPSGEPTLGQLLADLKVERERIEGQIRAVEEVIHLQEARRNGG